MILTKLCLLLLFTVSNTYASDPDTLFRQPISVKYQLPVDQKGAELKKVVVDDDGIAYVLTNQDLLRSFNNQLAKDHTYRPLAGIIPVDITSQEKKGHLYYLYKDKLLSNAYGGKPYGLLPKGEFHQMAVNAGGHVLLAGEKTIALYDQDQLKRLKKPNGNIGLVCR